MGDETDETAPQEPDALLSQAKARFKQAHEAHRDDFEDCKLVQDFIALDQWPQKIKSERESMGRPCLTLDHLNQYVRHVVNGGLMQARDVRVLALSGEADDQVGEILAGMIRQITQSSTASVAYETGLRHSCQVGFGYWRVLVQDIVGGDGLQEIVIRKIKDPRMVLLDPFCDYPDGRDAQYCFVLSKMTEKEFREQYGDEAELGSWQEMDQAKVLPWITEGAVVVAEYYYRQPDGTVMFAVLSPTAVLQQGVHHGNVIPIVRTVGEEYEQDGKHRLRGLINLSSMDAQRAYNYSSSAFIEAVALAPLAPFVAEEGQVEPFQQEWKEAHRVPRAVLRYKGVSISGQMLPPPSRSAPAGIPEGWQGMMSNLISDQQMIMGLAQPSVLGTGGSPVQSGAGVNAQQAPGEINSFHLISHWHTAIEQTGRIILAMIPHVYTQAQAVKITGDDGVMTTAMLNPQQGQTFMEHQDAYNKVLSASYNVNIGRYDVAMTTGPSSASKRQEANKTLMTVVNAFPELMRVAGDLVVGSMDMAGADVLAKRLKGLLPPGTTEDAGGQLAIIQQLHQENGALKQQMQELTQAVMAEREKAQAGLIEEQMKSTAKLQERELQASADSFRQHLDDQKAIQVASIKSQSDLEIAARDGVVKIMVAKIAAGSKIDVELIKSFIAASQMPTHEERMGRYMESMGSMTSAPMPVPAPIVEEGTYAT
jgi:hypothetical protein